MKLTLKSALTALTQLLGSRTARWLAVILFAGGLIWGAAAWADSRLRASQLEQARLIAQTIDVDRCKALTGLPADTNSPVYLRLKEQLAAIRSATPQCRFAYLVGRQTNGTIFFLVDSEAPDSANGFAAGQPFSEAPPGFQRVFATRKATTEGPYAGRCGQWISTLTPILDDASTPSGLATPEDALKMVKRAVAFYRQNGRERFLKEVNDPQGEFHKGDVYAFVYDRNMTMLAHPLKPEMVGQNWLNKKDWSGGKYFRREIQQVVQSSGHGWVEYEYENFASHHLDHKTTYVEGVDDLIVSSGAYRGDAKILAVLGMDQDSRDWKWAVAKQAMLPLALLLVLGTGIVAAMSVGGTHMFSENLLPRRHRHAAWIVLGAALTLVAAATWFMRQEVDKNAERDFLQHTDKIAATISERLEAQTRVLESGAAFFNASDRVTRERWRIFSQSERLEKQLPGIQGIGFALVIPPAELSRHVQEIRAEGFPDYQVKPVGHRDIYTSIIFLEPFSGRNLRAFGYDMFSEPVRRAAMEQARDTGAAALTGKVILVQEDGKDIQAGALMYEPVYRPGLPTGTVAERRAALYGWVYSPYRMNDLVRGIFSARNQKPDPLLNFSLFDGEQPSDDHLLFADRRTEKEGAAKVRFTRQKPIVYNGHYWTLTFNQSAGELLSAEYSRVWLVLVGGTFIALQLFILIQVLVKTHAKAQRIADALTVELRDSEQAYRNQFAKNSTVMLLMNPEDGALLAANEAAVKFYGYPAAQLLGMRITDLNTLPAAEIFRQMASIRRDQGQRFLFEHRLADGSIRNVDVSTSLVQFGSRMVMHSIIFDVTDRKQMEAKAAALLLRHQTLLQAGSDGIHILDENGSVLEVNLAFCQMLGYSREELLRLHVADWDVQFPKTELPALIAQLLATTRVFETRHRTKNGAILEVEINARGITLEGKKLLFASARDITERKRLELEVREQRNLLVSIIEGTNVGTWRWNVVTGQTEFNERWAEITGYTLAELAPVSIQTWHGLAHPDGLQESARVLAEHFSGATRHYDFEGRMRHKNGSWVWVHDRGKVIEWTADGQPLVMTGTRSDITARKQVEDTLRKYSWALEQSPTSVVITNAIGNIEFVNPCFCRVTGYTAAECLGQNPRILKSGQTPPQEYRQLWEAITHGEEWHGDFLNKKKNGEFYWERAHISAIKNQHGQITHYLALKEDITAHKQAESDLLETNRSLELATARANELAVRSELASAAKSDFLANMSHEIRTPMNGVLGMLGLLQGTLQTEEQRQYTAAARASGETLLALINDILDFSKIEAGKMELETVDFNLPILLDDFTEMMAPRAHQKDLVFGCVVAPQIPPALQGDPGRLRQILTNLAANAIKFTDHGQVVIRVDPVAETAGEVQLHFSVHDTGIGIPEDKLSRLFAKFTQVDSSTTRLYGGSGLGLAISKQLVEMMGGEIGVHSVVGQGAEFWFRIRLPKNPALNLAPEPLHAGLRGLRVLVVESQAIHCETLLGLLKAWGMRPEAAGTAAAALPALAQAQSAHDGFALAILQQELPDQDAFALSGLIKRHPDLKATKLVLGLPLGQKPLISDGGGDLFAATLSLPVHRNKLRAVLESVVCGKTPSASPAHVLPGLAAVNKSQRARILVVDDNATNQLVAVGILKKLGLNTEVAGAGAEAVQALETADFDLVLMDAQMPGMDGLQATRIIRDPQSSVRNHHVPIIAMTARAMLGDREECLQAGMDDYLTKPFEVPALIAILEKWLPSPRQNPPSQDLPVAPAQPASGSGAEPIFDRAEFLDRIMNDEAIAREVISAFMADLPVQIAKLKAYAAAGDATQVGKQAHKIKGAAANVSAGALRALTAALEAAGSANNQALIAQKLTELDRQYEALLAAVAQVF